MIDSEHTSSGRHGFLRLNGFFSSYVDKKLEINSDTFHAMNHLHQRKAVKEMYSSHQTTPLHTQSRMREEQKFPTLEALAASPRANSVLAYKKCHRIDKWWKRQTFIQEANRDYFNRSGKQEAPRMAGGGRNYRSFSNNKR